MFGLPFAFLGLSAVWADCSTECHRNTTLNFHELALDGYPEVTTSSAVYQAVYQECLYACTHPGAVHTATAMSPANDQPGPNVHPGRANDPEHYERSISEAEKNFIASLNWPGGDFPGVAMVARAPDYSMEFERSTARFPNFGDAFSSQGCPGGELGNCYGASFGCMAKTSKLACETAAAGTCTWTCGRVQRDTESYAREAEDFGGYGRYGDRDAREAEDFYGRYGDPDAREAEDFGGYARYGDPDARDAEDFGGYGRYGDPDAREAEAYARAPAFSAHTNFNRPGHTYNVDGGNFDYLTSGAGTTTNFGRSIDSPGKGDQDWFRDQREVDSLETKLQRLLEEFALPRGGIGGHLGDKPWAVTTKLAVSRSGGQEQI